MPEVARPGYVIEHPNRKKAASKATRAAVVLMLLATAGLLVVVTVGGWDSLQAARGVQVAFVVLFAGLALLVARWRRGVLPVAAALSVVVLILAAVSAPAWFERDRPGFTNPALDSGIVGALTLGLVPLQVLVIAFAMRGFAQAWNVEVERPAGDVQAGRREPRPV